MVTDSLWNSREPLLLKNDTDVVSEKAGKDDSMTCHNQVGSHKDFTYNVIRFTELQVHLH